jgi:hypothetical protein
VSRFVAKGFEGVCLSRLALEGTEENYGTFESGRENRKREDEKSIKLLSQRQNKRTNTVDE